MWIDYYGKFNCCGEIKIDWIGGALILSENVSTISSSNVTLVDIGNGYVSII